MKKIFLTLSLFIAFLTFIFIPPAVACHFGEVELNADCDGFIISGELCAHWFWHDGATMTYNLQINYTDAYGFSTVIPVYGFATRYIDSDIPACLPFEPISGAWETEFCGDVFITGTLDLVSLNDPGETDSAILNTLTEYCPCACTRTPGYWKNPKKPWPVDSLVIGGVTYTRSELLVLLKLPAKEHDFFGNDVKLFHHLVAAMLNVAAEPDNNTPSIQALITAADAYFEFGTWGLLDPGAMKDALDDFNNSGEYLCD